MSTVIAPRARPLRNDRVRSASISRPAGWTALLAGLRETSCVGVAVLVYFLVRGLMDAELERALANGERLVNLERHLGIFGEQRWQAAIVPHDWLVNLVNGVYIYGHWPLIALTLLWLFLCHRSVFGVYRTAMVVSGLIGFACFSLYPMAPPRFMPDYGFVDTVVMHSEAYRVLQPPSLTNQFAAMPSLHVGWNLLMGIALVRHARLPLVRVFGALMPLAMYAATILTGNHFFLDGVVGAAIVLVALAIAWRVSGPRLVVWRQYPLARETGANAWPHPRSARPVFPGARHTS